MSHEAGRRRARMHLVRDPQSRAEADTPQGRLRPHFGLGLYIVRLIAEFHGGSAQAANLPDHSGAIFTIRLTRRFRDREFGSVPSS